MSIKNMQQTLPTNEDATTVGVGNVYPNPDGRSPGTLDARWGDAPAEPVGHGTGVEREAANDRAEMLGRLFDTLNGARGTERALVGRQFAHADVAESHSPLLQRKHAAAHVPEAPSLMDRVIRVAGRP